MPEVKFKIDEDGLVSIDLYALLYRLDGEDLNNMIEALSWQDSIIHRLVGNLKNQYASDFTNSNLYRIRRLFFTVDGDYEKESIIRKMNSTIETILSEIAKEKADKLKMQQAWYAVYHTIEARFGDDYAWDINKIYLDAKHDSDDSALDISREMLFAKEMPDKKGLIESWVNEMIELFGEKKDNNE